MNWNDTAAGAGVRFGGLPAGKGKRLCRGGGYRGRLPTCQLANLPTCQLFDILAFRLVGKLGSRRLGKWESWRVRFWWAGSTEVSCPLAVGAVEGGGERRGEAGARRRCRVQVSERRGEGEGGEKKCERGGCRVVRSLEEVLQGRGGLPADREKREAASTGWGRGCGGGGVQEGGGGEWWV